MNDKILENDHAKGLRKGKVNILLIWAMILVQTTECGMVMMLKVLKIKCGVICNLTSVTIYIYIYHTEQGEYTSNLHRSKCSKLPKGSSQQNYEEKFFMRLMHTSDLYLVSLRCHNAIQQTEWFKKQKFSLKLIFSQFWRPEVWDQGIRCSVSG